ncbi:MAG: isopentenyl-diphosphate Delta-isomerase [Candidatus Peribacteraceae bacterium]|nr:isopentenyl-diphosphate Delta-isomerase [Candidatus Peribacteraceae bacterium]
MRSVVLCDAKGQPLRSASIEEAHRGNGKLHLAFSIFVFSEDRTKVLLQKRSSEKLLFDGLWGNTCCSHPQKGESIEDAARKRLKEECGFTCDLTPVGSFTYQANDPHGKGSEHEYDTVLIGKVEQDIEMHPDPTEIEELKWMAIDTLQSDLAAHSDRYGPWLKPALDIVLRSAHGRG